MCFSATASFIAGTALSVAGVATLAITKTKKERLFATIPLLFGLQQLTEGVIWLTFHKEAPALKQTTTFVYSLFSHVLWPVYVPFAILFLETSQWRRKVISAFGFVGIAVGLYLLYYLVNAPVTAEVSGSHIIYVSPHFYTIPVMLLYLSASCVSCFFSSHLFVKLFGILLLLSFIAAYIVHVQTLVSVWCFFAAILSLTIYFHFKFGHVNGRKAPSFSALLPVK